MSPNRKADLQRKLAMAPIPKPPAGLAIVMVVLNSLGKTSRPMATQLIWVSPNIAKTKWSLS